MRSKKVRTTAKSIFAIFVTLLLASVNVPAQSPAPKFKVLHTFHGGKHDGALPLSQLTRDASGNLYGTTNAGGNGKGICVNFFNGCGTAFKLDKNGKLIWLHSFNLGNGAVPDTGLLRDKEGSLYGTTTLGGDTSCYEYGCGTVFKLDSAGKETVLHKFHGGPDGSASEALLAEDGDANLYGTTLFQGAFNNGGTIFKVGNRGMERVLYSFCSETNCIDGNFSPPGLILDRKGNLYGVTGDGGASNHGEVFEFDRAANLKVLYSFSGGLDGSSPVSVLIADSSGNLYGTTERGGNLACGGGDGCGVVFELSPNAGGWEESVLYVFCSLSNCTDGQVPLRGPLVRDTSGNLYGTTIFGGDSRYCNGEGCGVVFKLDSSGRETVLHSFTLRADGGTPSAGLIMDKSGNLYGTTTGGGDISCSAGSGDGCGVVFKLTP